MMRMLNKIIVVLVSILMVGGARADGLFFPDEPVQYGIQVF